MDAFILYMAKTSGLIVLFYAAYYLLLKKETFFTPNRWFLLAGLVTAALLPLLEFTKIIWVAPVAQVPLSANDFQMITRLAAVAQYKKPQITFTDVALGVYCSGMILFLARFLTDLSFIKELVTGNKATKTGRFRLIDSPEIESPFSFFNYIVYNSASLQPHELESILAHEKVHSAQRHSADMIIGQLFCVVFWFNPFAWLYKKAISQNLEFIADAGATAQVPDVVAYQKTLLKITMQPGCIAITNHFYQSLIKKRIIMLNKQKSSWGNALKYLLVMPALAAFILLFQVKVVAQEKTVAQDIPNIVIVQAINKDTKDSELEEDKKLFKQEFDADVAFSQTTRNNKNEITAIKVEVKAQGKEKVYQVSSTKPIEPFKIMMERGDDGNLIITLGQNNTIPEPPSAFALSAVYADTLVQSTNHITPVMPNAPLAITCTSGNAENLSLNIGNSDALIVINGVKFAKGQDIKLPAGHQITIVNTLDKKEGKEKYGKEGKKGVLEIITAAKSVQSLVIQKPANASYGYSLNTNGSGGIEFTATDLSIDDMALALKQFNRLKLHMVNNDEIDNEWIEGYRKLITEMKDTSDRLDGEADSETYNAETNRALVRFDAKKAELDKKRAELKKKRELLLKDRRAMETERAKAKELRKAAQKGE